MGGRVRSGFWVGFRRYFVVSGVLVSSVLVSGAALGSGAALASSVAGAGVAAALSPSAAFAAAGFSAFCSPSQAVRVARSSSLPFQSFMCFFPSFAVTSFFRNWAIHSGFTSRPILERSGGLWLGVADTSPAGAASFFSPAAASVVAATFFSIPAELIVWQLLQWLLRNIFLPAGSLASSALAVPQKATATATAVAVIHIFFMIANLLVYGVSPEPK